MGLDPLEAVIPTKATVATSDDSPALVLYRIAESINHLADTLPEDQAGIELLLVMIGQEVQGVAERLDNENA